MWSSEGKLEKVDARLRDSRRHETTLLRSSRNLTQTDWRDPSSAAAAAPEGFVSFMSRIEAASEQIDDVLVKRCSLLAAAAAAIVPRKRQVFDAGPITRQWNLKGPHSNGAVLALGLRHTSDTT